MNSNAKIGRSHANLFDAAKNNAQYAELKKDPVQVIARIVRNQKTLYSKEILNWKMARSEAESIYHPRRVLLTELYKDILLDSFVLGIIENKRKLNVSNKPWKIINKTTKEEDEVATELLDQSWFIKFIKYALDSTFHGHSLIYFNEWANGQASDIALVPRDHVRPENSEWLAHQYDMSGFNYTEAPFNRYMLGIGDKDNLGILNPAAPLYILKKHSWANWDEFEEIFGIPIRIAKVASQDTAVRAEVERWLSAMGSAAYGVFPQDTELDIKENKSTDAFQVFNEKRRAANEELEILLLGVKSASDNGGTYGKQKALNDEISEVTADDQKFIFNLVNSKLIPLLRQNGYPFTDDHKFIWDELDSENSSTKVNTYKTLHDMGYELNPDQISSDLGVDILGVREMESKEDNVDDKKKKDPEDTYIKLNNTLHNLYFGKNVH